METSLYYLDLVCIQCPSLANNIFVRQILYMLQVDQTSPNILQANNAERVLSCFPLKELHFKIGYTSLCSATGFQ